MNLTIEHFPFRLKFGEEKALEMIKNAGFDGIDYSFNHNGQGVAIDLNDHVKKATYLNTFIKNIGLSCTQAHAPFEVKYGDEFTVDNAAFSNMIRVFEFAAIIGVKVIVIHSIRVPENGDFFNCNFDYYKALEPYAKKFGIKIAVENLVNSIFWHPVKLSQFIRQLNSDVFCACIDVGHSMITGMQPENFISGMDKNLIKCIHLHDTDGKGDKHWIPFQGIQNWEKTIESLVEYGYDGDMGLEVIHSFDNLPTQLYQSLLRHTADVGKYLVNRFETIKSAN